MRRITLIVAFLALGAAVQAQMANYRFDYFAYNVSGGGINSPMLAIPGATIYFYSCSGGVCNTAATTYQSATSTSTCPAGQQVTWQPPAPSGCQANADQTGSFGGWFQPGEYAYVINGVSGPRNFTVGAISSGTNPTGPAGGSLSGNYPNPSLAPLTSGTAPPLFAGLTGCAVAGYVFSPQSGTCVVPSPAGAAGGALNGTYPNPGLLPLTVSTAPPLFAGLTGCGTTGYVFSPQSGTCVAQSGGGGTPGGSTTQGQYNNAGAFAGTSAATYRTADGSVSQFANVQYLSCSSELGAQINSAVTALENVGVIQLPNCTTATMTTTATNIPPGISIRGYGKLATIIHCTVAGDCFQFSMNPTTVGEIASEISSFGMTGSGAGGQVLMHFNGASGYVLHGLQFEGYGGSGGAATCLEFDNSASGLFTEGNVSYDVELERSCTTGVLFNQNAGDSDNSFGYNFFQFHVVAMNGNYAIVFNGSGVLYGGSLTVFGNHVGPNGGIIQFNSTFSTGNSTLGPAEQLYVNAEENGSGAGTVIDAAGGAVLSFVGSVMNGGGAANPLATTYGGAGIADFTLNQGIHTDYLGNASLPANLTIGAGATGGTYGGLVVEGSAPAGVIGVDIIGEAAQPYAGFQIDATLQSGGCAWDNIVSAHNYVFLGLGGCATEPFVLVPDGSTYKNLAMVGALTQFCWNVNAQYANVSSVCDTGISRAAAGTIAFGNGTQGNASAQLQFASWFPGIIFSAAGTPVPTCTSGLKGLMVQVSDATSPTYNGTYTSGGAVLVPVLCNGSTWTTH